MTTDTQPQQHEQSEDDPWETIAEHEDVLEHVIEEDLPFAKYAKRLLRGLEERGYR